MLPSFRTTFQRLYSKGLPIVDMILRVNFRVGAVMKYEQVSAQLRMELGSGQLKIFG